MFFFVCSDVVIVVCVVVIASPVKFGINTRKTVCYTYREKEVAK